MDTILNILIVDDEAAGRGILQKLLPDILTVPFATMEAESVAAALQLLGRQKMDLLFLDVQMPEQNGFDLLKQVAAIDFEIIFVTGFDKYAVHAFRFNALDYLLKPVEIAELRQAVEKAILRIGQKKNSSKNVSELLHGLKANNTDKRVAVHVNDRVVFIAAKEISHISAMNNYSEIVTGNGEKFVTPRVLKEFEFYFEESDFFVRINRSVLINASYIKSYTKDIPCNVQMKGGASFEISRRRKSEVLQQLESL